MLYYQRPAKILKLSKKNHKYYEIIAKTITTPTQENFFNKLKQVPILLIFAVLLVVLPAFLHLFSN